MPVDIPAVHSASKPRTRASLYVDYVAVLVVAGIVLGFWLGQVSGFHKAELKYKSALAGVVSDEPSPEGMALYGPNVPSADGRSRDGHYRPPMYPNMLYTCRVPRHVDRPELYLPKPMHVIKCYGVGESTDLGWQTEYMMVAPGATYKFYGADQPSQPVLFRLVCEDRDDAKWEFQPID